MLLCYQSSYGCSTNGTSHLQLQILNAELQRLEFSYTKTQENLFQGLCEKVFSGTLATRISCHVFAPIR